jgi:hypothetical protein
VDYGSHDLSHAERVVYVGMTEYEHYFSNNRNGYRECEGEQYLADVSQHGRADE